MEGLTNLSPLSSLDIADCCCRRRRRRRRRRLKEEERRRRRQLALRFAPFTRVSPQLGTKFKSRD